MLGLILPICSIFFSLLLFIIYFSKKRVNLLENKMYTIMIVCILIDSILTTSLQIFPLSGLTTFEIFLVEICNKIDFATVITFDTSLFMYIMLISYPKVKENYKKFFNYTLTINLILILIISFFDISIIENNGNYSIEGSAVTFTYLVCAFYISSALLASLFNMKKIDKRYIPIFIIIPMLGFVFFLFSINPYLTIISIIQTYVMYIMFFTIENPDLKLIEELNVAKDQAEKANNAKTDFLSNMSHEIRTPLNAIVGFSNGLLEDNNIPEESKEDIKNIITASDNLIELVNGILDISKIEANKLEIINTNYNFKKLFNDLLILTKARLGEKPLELKYYYDETIPEYLYGDVSRIKQIIINLLTNSVKYTKEGYIYFKVNAIKKENIIRLIISVEDTGIGIKQENINKLFTKFERLGVEKNTTTEGTGLGLAITKKLVELMNGKIIVQSIYGKGSKFTVSIDQRISNQQEIENIKKETETKITHENIDITNKKILIVDDNNLNLKVAERLLKKYTQNIQTASSGQECLDKINNNEKFDLILLDDMMPKMSGTLTLEKLKENENFKTPVVVLTANAISGMKEQYLSKGFDDYLSKPIEKGELIRVIKKFLS